MVLNGCGFLFLLRVTCLYHFGYEDVEVTPLRRRAHVHGHTLTLTLTQRAGGGKTMSLAL